jgi:hypothetical protein
MFGGSIDTLAEFGLQPRKTPAAVPPAEKVAAVQKALATRKARNTMGAKQGSCRTLGMGVARGGVTSALGRRRGLRASS